VPVVADTLGARPAVHRDDSRVRSRAIFGGVGFVQGTEETTSFGALVMRRATQIRIRLCFLCCGYALCVYTVEIDC
jgi:hypothetical protein